jgi:TRAP-type C4-dicarboxylate transport system substrate-binding protein
MDPGQIALYESFGASGTPIPWTELYMALQTGVVDGQMNPPTYIISGSLYEVQDFVTMANIQYSCQWLTINADWLNSLSEEYQYIIRRSFPIFKNSKNYPYCHKGKESLNCSCDRRFL